MESVICCCEVRSWAIYIAWIQIAQFIVELFLVGVGLTVILVAGKDAVDKAGIPRNPDEGTVADIYWNWTSEYVQLVLYFVISAIILFLGIILAVLLIKGTKESKSRYLKWWVIRSVMCLVLSILTEVFSADKIPALVLRLSAICFLYGFSIFVVVTLIKEIELKGRPSTY